MSSIKKVLVTGATGQQGGAVVNALLAKGHKVRGLTRRAGSPAAKAISARGVEVMEGDYTDANSLFCAATGVDTVYAMMTPFEAGVKAEIKQGIAMVDAAKKAGVGHFILSSVASADQMTGIPHFDSKFEVEKYVEASGLDYTISAPVYFMENLLAPWMLPQLRKGILTHALPGNRRLQQISIRTIGEFVAALVDRREDAFGRRYEIAGDELTGEEQAVILSRVIGRSISYEGFSPDVMRKQSEDMAIMYEWFDHTGYKVDLDALGREFPEMSWIGVEEWAKLQDWAILEEIALAG